MGDGKLSRNPLTMPEDLLYEQPALSPQKKKPSRDVVLATFSLYPEDVEKLEALVKTLKSQGKRGVNKSRIIRQAIEAFSVEDYRPPR